MRKNVYIVLFFITFINWWKTGKAFDKNTSYILKSTIPAYTVAVESYILDNSSVCRKQLDIFRVAVDNKELWSLLILDASGEPKPGFLYGNRFWLGVKSQCLDVHNEYVDGKSLPFPVNYYAAYLEYKTEKKKKTTLILGLCLPEICTTEDLAEVLKKILREELLVMSNFYTGSYTLLNVKDLKDDYYYLLNWKIIIVGILMICSFILITIGTVYDVFVHSKHINNNEPVWKNGFNTAENKINETSVAEKGQDLTANSKKIKTNTLGQVLVCFSIFTNTKLLFNTNEGADSIRVVHGLKCISMIWIIMLHAYLSFTTSYTDNLVYLEKIRENPLAKTISNGTVAVDTFFFLSGFLLVYIFYKQENKKKSQGKPPTKLSPQLFFKTVSMRFIRLTPAYLMTIVIVFVYNHHFDKSSQFDLWDRPGDNCDKYWWKNLLYINNLFDIKFMCTSWSWYLPNDMQFYIIGLILTVCSFTYFYACAAIWTGLMIFTVFFTGTLSYIYSFTFTPTSQNDKISYFYISPWCRIGPYLIGIATAYFLVTIKHKWEAKKSTLWMLWIIGTIAIVGPVLLTEKTFSIFLTAIYLAVCRTIWSLGIAWIVIACSTNHGGFLNTFLSSKLFVPLSRLTYCAYLINPIVISSSFLSADVSTHHDFMLQLPTFIGQVVLTYMVSYVFYLMFEKPYILLLKI